jgi:hypothetical protein
LEAGKRILNTEILLSSDPKTICSFIGLDYNRWLQGFERMEPLFEWLIQCRFMDPSLFLKHSKSDGERRPMIAQFRDHVHHHFKHTDDVLNDGVLQEIQSEALSHFKKNEEFDAIRERFMLEAAMKRVFNGRLVGQWTGLSGPALGDLMQKVRSNFSISQLAAMTEDEVRTACLKLHSDHSK